jgi:hypothetical protein
VRRELYLDDKDIHKWSVTISAAQQNGQSIFWVTMLRPDIGKHGDGRRTVPGAVPEVAAFIEDERKAKHRDLSRMAVLCGELGVDLATDLSLYPTALGERGRYFVEVRRALETESQGKRLVFLDPDNGVGTSNREGRQIHPDHLRSVWSALRQGDTLAVVQFSHRNSDWVGLLQTRIAQILDVPVAHVRPQPWGIVCLYLVDRISIESGGFVGDVPHAMPDERRIPARQALMLDHCLYCDQPWKGGSFPVGWDGHAEFVCQSVADLPQEERKPAFRGMMLQDGYQLGRKRRTVR